MSLGGRGILLHCCPLLHLPVSSWIGCYQPAWGSWTWLCDLWTCPSAAWTSWTPSSACPALCVGSPASSAALPDDGHVLPLAHIVFHVIVEEQIFNPWLSGPSLCNHDWKDAGSETDLWAKLVLMESKMGETTIEFFHGDK